MTVYYCKYVILLMNIIFVYTLGIWLQYVRFLNGEYVSDRTMVH